MRTALSQAVKSQTSSEAKPHPQPPVSKATPPPSGTPNPPLDEDVICRRTNTIINELAENRDFKVLYVQWNPSNADTNGAEESVLYREVSFFRGLKCMQEWYLGWEKVSLLERCPQFRGVLIEGFHCIYLCSTMRGRIKGTDSTINAILATAVLYELRWKIWNGAE